MDWSDSEEVKVRVSGNHSYMAADEDGVVYDEEYPSHSIDAAFKEGVPDLAVETNYNVGDFDDWVSVEVVDDGGTYRARLDDNSEEYSGDMPGEAVFRLLDREGLR